MIDVHCHYYPERYAALLERLSGATQPRFRYPTTDAADQIAGRLELNRSAAALFGTSLVSA